MARGPDDRPETGRCLDDDVVHELVAEVADEAAVVGVEPKTAVRDVLDDDANISRLTWSRKSLKLPNRSQKPLQSVPGLIWQSLVAVANR